LAASLRELARRVGTASAGTLHSQTAVYAIRSGRWDRQKPAFEPWKGRLAMWIAATAFTEYRTLE